MQDVRIELASDISIFVGANNSAKTSATQAIRMFVSGSREDFSLHDFSSSTWKVFDDIGNSPESDAQAAALPCITLDLWFEVIATDLYLVMPLLPSITWQGTQVGLRIEFGAINSIELLQGFRAAYAEAQERATELEGGAGDYVPWPKNLSDYLQKELHKTFEFKYFVLDRTQFNDKHIENEGYQPVSLAGQPGGAALLKSLIRVDNLSAQRHLADPSASGSGARSEDLSRRLSRFYKRNLDQRKDDHSALKALFQSEAALNTHLSEVFEPTLKRLGMLGYPGLHNPRLQIKSALNPAAIMSGQDAQVHYVLSDGPDAITLPDTYNGLGFKNLIYMVVEILDLHARWIAEDESRPPLHIIFIEEPEAHLHAQLQQVFIRNVLSLVKIDSEEESAFRSQMVITTHSPHILYERGFRPVRYFRRSKINEHQTVEVLNLSAFYDETPTERDFLQRYLKLTHCDLFFADAAVLVEGNVERLLLPVMIEKNAPKLCSACLCILEVGGAFGHKFRSLIEFLGLPVLVVTDLDSVELVPDGGEEAEDQETEFESLGEGENAGPVKKRGTTCLPSVPGAVTSNQTLIKWLPKKKTIADLFAATDVDKVQQAPGLLGAKIRVAYQVPIDVSVNGVTTKLCGRTLEEAFGLENAAWCQATTQKQLGLKLRVAPANPTQLAEGLHKRVNGNAFEKTKFALAVLTENPNQWEVPAYIREGLTWLEQQVDLESLPEVAEAAAQVNEAQIP